MPVVGANPTTTPSTGGIVPITAEPVLAPGSTVTLDALAGVLASAAPAATAMLAGFSDRGPLNVPTRFADIWSYGRVYGGRSGAAATLYDSVDVLLQEGNGQASGWASRVAGPAATVGSLTDLDRAGTPQPTVKVSCAFVGAASSQILRSWSDGNVAGSFTLRVYDTLVSSTVPVEVFPDLPDIPTAKTRVNGVSAYVTLTDLASPSSAALRIPAVTSITALSAGSDDRAGAGDAQWAAAINAFSADYGAGLMLAPGRSTASVHALLSAAALATYRTALYDGPDLPLPSDLKQLAATDSLLPGYLSNGDVGQVVGPWVIAPAGSGSSSTRVVPASAALAGLIARNDAVAGNAARASLGRYGNLRYCTGVSGPLTEGDRDNVDGGPGVTGASLIRSTRSNPAQVMGFRTTSAEPLLGYDGAGMRETAWVKWNLKRIADTWVGASITTQTFKDLQGELDAFLTGEFNTGALYAPQGGTKTDAFAFDTGPLVNTPQTAAALRIKVNGWFKVAGTGFRVDVAETRRGVTA